MMTMTGGGDIAISDEQTNSWFNSATASRLFVQEHGGSAMSGRQVTIKKAALSSLPVPAALKGPTVRAELAHMAQALQGGTALKALVGEVRQGPDAQADRALHQRVAGLYGLDAEQEEAAYQWWLGRV